MVASAEFQTQWRERLASGSKLAAKALGIALRDDASRIGLIVPLTRDAQPAIRVATFRALEEVAASRPALVAPFATDIVAGLAAAEPDAQAAALGTLSQIASHARPEMALALPMIADLLRSKRPSIREAAIRCVGRVGTRFPDSAAPAAHALGHTLAQLRNPRASAEAREVLAALEGLVPHLPADERAYLAGAIAPMRAHPNIQVRERAGRIAKSLA